MGIQGRPVVESAVLAPLGGLIARGGSDLTARALLGLSLIGKDEATKERAFSRMKAGKGYKTFKNVLTGAGALAGAAYPMVKNYNSNVSLKENLSKYTNRDQYYKDNPGALEQEGRDAVASPNQAVDEYIPGGAGYRSGRTMSKYAAVRNWEGIFSAVDNKSGYSDLLLALDKAASEKDEIPEHFLIDVIAHGQSMDKEAFYNSEDPQGQLQYDFHKNVIPVHQGRQMIHRDPFLTNQDKSMVDSVMINAGEGKSGSISGFDIASTAVKAGIGLAAGIAFGKTMGNLFSMGSAQTSRLSNIGAVAGALYNTGIFSKEL
jgi:hypothetical protein